MSGFEDATAEVVDEVNQPKSSSTYIADIFGEDSDDDNIPVRKATHAQDDDAIFGDSDDDDVPVRGTNRLRKGNQSKATASRMRDTLDDNDDDIDDDELAEFGIRKTHKEKRIGKQKKKSKLRSADGGRERPSKRQRSTEDGDDYNGAGSGDEYDSGDDLVRTADDDNFIDDDDDLGDIVGEYDAEEQNFDDDRPGKFGRSKGKAKGAGKSSQESKSSGSRKGASDPFSQLLETMKKPKASEMTDAEKDRLADKLLRRMHDACVKDEECFRQGLPAVHKLQLLKTVQQMTSMKAMQHSLLEKDILGSLRDWIEPKKDANKTLPSLAVRTAVFDILMKLPCQTDHLKRSDGDKKPIGHTILALRKHKMETPENKRLLKELMEKWCRPVFGKVSLLVTISFVMF